MGTVISPFLVYNPLLRVFQCPFKLTCFSLGVFLLPGAADGRDLLKADLPRLHGLLLENNIELALICVNWFLTIFCNVTPMPTALRIWDYFMYDGSRVSTILVWRRGISLFLYFSSLSFLLFSLPLSFFFSSSCSLLML